MKTFLVCATALLLTGPLTALAQSRSISEAPSTEQRLAEEIGLERLLPDATALRSQDARNVSILIQEGTGNRSTLQQTNSGALANSIYVQQVGFYNEAELTQTGSGNRTTVGQQGTANRVESELLGSNNELTVMQDGNNNQVASTVLNDNRRYTITQTGTNNVLNQVESSPAAPQGYTVEMRGNGIRMTIEQGRAIP
jgi:minor curlin subunit